MGSKVIAILAAGLATTATVLRPARRRVVVSRSPLMIVAAGRGGRQGARVQDRREHHDHVGQLHLQGTW